MSNTYKIHPGIGIARVGNSPTGYFIGPEVPGQTLKLSDADYSSPPNGNFKAAPGKIKRQGARFRVYEYEVIDGIEIPKREITKDIAKITWKVTLGNRKAYGPKFDARGVRNDGIPKSHLIIESEEVTISGSNAGMKPLKGSFQCNARTKVSVPLGHLSTDSAGRLIVFGGFGKSFSPTATPLQPREIFNNDDWCDDTSDGPVKASIDFPDSEDSIDVEVPAWVIVGPPDFAPPIGNVITLYDIVYEAAFKQFGIHADPCRRMGKISFTRHVYPLLRRTADVFWVDRIAFRGTHGHKPGMDGDFLRSDLLVKLASNDKSQSSPEYKARKTVFNTLRSPTNNRGMPVLQRETNPARSPRLTDLVYQIMEAWYKGNFESDLDIPAAKWPADLSDLHVKDRPFALDKAALDNCVGASFYPGIEAPRILRDNLSVYEAPFRIQRNEKPGFITQGLALPWQTDFLACRTGWWPAQRPNDVFQTGNTTTSVMVGWIDNVNSRKDMVKKWAQLGYVVENPDYDPDDVTSVRYIEDERDIARAVS